MRRPGLPAVARAQELQPPQQRYQARPPPWCNGLWGQSLSSDPELWGRLPSSSPWSLDGARAPRSSCAGGSRTRPAPALAHAQRSLRAPDRSRTRTLPFARPAPSPRPRRPSLTHACALRPRTCPARHPRLQDQTRLHQVRQCFTFSHYGSGDMRPKKVILPLVVGHKTPQFCGTMLQIT